MDSDRHPPPPHRPTTTSDLFICFTSRHHHSSSMKLPSKSILSPNRASGRDPPFSLTTSLSRRLRTNRSIKGAASPAMFPATGKKRGSGSGFDNPEPSSPKVTCIGQVRIKSKKKHGKQQRLRSLSRRHSTGDVSFRKLGSNSFGSNNERNNNNNNNNQRWVHLPLTICEALRAFGSEFSCLFPCRSSCFSPVRERDVREQRMMTSDRGEEEEQSSGPSCAAVFTRWLVAFHDGDDGGRGGRRDVELVVTGDNINQDDEDEEDRMFRTSRRHVFDDLEIVGNRIQGSVDEPRVSICIPPKNALLLMRCRSDPLKMEALANRLWESTVSQHDDEQDDQDEEYVDDEDEDVIQANDEVHMEQSIEDKEQIPVTNDEKDDEFTFFGSLFDEMVDQDQENDETEEVKGFTERSESMVTESKERESVLEREGLPECLLLMMYEPKLSMEVSKETWVSSKDFIRRQPSRKKPPAPLPVPVKPTDGQSTGSANTSFSTTTTNDTLPSACKNSKHVSASVAASAAAMASASVQPGRSSCSLPAPSSMAEMLEQKLVNAVGYEPFVLTRCKSEPMRTAAAKLAPDNCFWKNRKLEPLRRASFGVGAAGVGF